MGVSTYHGGQILLIIVAGQYFKANKTAFNFGELLSVAITLTELIQLQ
jgi:hypothetical protein